MYQPNLNIVGRGPMGRSYHRARANAVLFAVIRRIQRNNNIRVSKLTVTRMSGWWWPGLPHTNWALVQGFVGRNN